MHQILKIKECTRTKGTNSVPGFETKMAYNLALQQIGREQNSEYFDSDAGLTSQLMEQIQNSINTQGYNYVQQFYQKKGLQIFHEDGGKGCKKGARSACQKTLLETNECRRYDTQKKRKKLKTS